MWLWRECLFLAITTRTLRMSSTLSSETAEGKELSLISKVELRIALTDTDAKLESTLKTYLAPLLLKLGSPHVNIRNKVCSSPPFHIGDSLLPYIVLLFQMFDCLYLQRDYLILLRIYVRKTLTLTKSQVISVCQHVNTRIKPPYVEFIFY